MTGPTGDLRVVARGPQYIRAIPLKPGDLWLGGLNMDKDNDGDVDLRDWALWSTKQ